MEDQNTQNTTPTDTAKTSDFARDGWSQEDTAREIAAQEVVKADKRPFVITSYNQVRRNVTPSSFTEAWARHAMDAAEAYKGMTSDTGRQLTDLMEPFYGHDGQQLGGTFTTEQYRFLQEAANRIVEDSIRRRGGKR